MIVVNNATLAEANKSLYLFLLLLEEAIREAQ